MGAFGRNGLWAVPLCLSLSKNSEKIIVAELLKKFSAFYVNRMIVTVMGTAGYVSVSWAEFI